MSFSVSDLACKRGDLAVFTGVSFTLTPGQALLLRGPNGSGKTTLLRCLAGLAPPLSGQITFSPEDVAYSAHADGLKAQMSVAETLSFWAAIYGTTQTDLAITAFTLAPLMHRKVATLSAGQKRRLSLARLPLSARPLWALDEPTVSLDSTAVSAFSSCVRAHLERGGSAIIATHIDLGLGDMPSFDMSQYKAGPSTAADPFLDEAFL